MSKTWALPRRWVPPGNSGKYLWVTHTKLQPPESIPASSLPLLHHNIPRIPAFPGHRAHGVTIASGLEVKCSYTTASSALGSRKGGQGACPASQSRRKRDIKTPLHLLLAFLSVTSERRGRARSDRPPLRSVTGKAQQG